MSNNDIGRLSPKCACQISPFGAWAGGATNYAYFLTQNRKFNKSQMKSADRQGEGGTLAVNIAIVANLRQLSSRTACVTCVWW
jgi:hypothetical protein